MENLLVQKETLNRLISETETELKAARRGNIEPFRGEIIRMHRAGISVKQQIAIFKTAAVPISVKKLKQFNSLLRAKSKSGTKAKGGAGHGKNKVS